MTRIGDFADAMKFVLDPIQPSPHLIDLARERLLFNEQDHDADDEEEETQANHDIPPERSKSTSGVIDRTITKP